VKKTVGYVLKRSVVDSVGDKKAHNKWTQSHQPEGGVGAL
jgi:hypothetical protein